MAEPAPVPKFKFDFKAVEGKPYDQAFRELFIQLQGHYNKFIQPPPLIFSAKQVPTIEFTHPDAPGAPPQKEKPFEPEVNIDVETITPKTRAMRTFAISEVNGHAIIEGVDSEGNPVSDQLLKGYDKTPYGPVVSGRVGRYNLKP